VQMLYLPGLQNVIADIFSRSSFSPWRHHHSDCSDADMDWSWTRKKIGFEAMAADQTIAWKCSACSEEHLHPLLEKK
jgi:hypothetical protein